MVEAMVISVNEAAKLLRLSRNATYQAVASKEIPSIRIGRRILIPKAALDALLDVAANAGTAAQQSYPQYSDLGAGRTLNEAETD